MRFRHRFPAKLGERRTSSWFALLPVTIEGETRWLENVTVVWELMSVPNFFPPCDYVPRWVKVDFIDDDTEGKN